MSAIRATVRIKLIKIYNRETKMAEELEDMEFISLYKCIKNTSTDGKTFTKHQLNSSKDLRHQKGQKRSPHNQVG